MPPVNSAISNGGISGNDLGMNGYNLGAPSGNTISNTNSNSGLILLNDKKIFKKGKWKAEWWNHLRRYLSVINVIEICCMFADWLMFVIELSQIKIT